jgi:hypothetical protein
VISSLKQAQREQRGTKKKFSRCAQPCKTCSE